MTLLFKYVLLVIMIEIPRPVKNVLMVGLAAVGVIAIEQEFIEPIVPIVRTAEDRYHDVSGTVTNTLNNPNVHIVNSVSHDGSPSVEGEDSANHTSFNKVEADVLETEGVVTLFLLGAGAFAIRRRRASKGLAR